MKFYTVFMLQLNARLQWVKLVRKINNSNTDPVEHTEHFFFKVGYSKHVHLSRGFRPSSLLLLAKGTVCFRSLCQKQTHPGNTHNFVPPQTHLSCLLYATPHRIVQI